MGKENIFIHIPKTGGTTINCVINKSEWQTKPDFHYRHIIYESKRSNTTDIFNPLNYDKFKRYNIFMLLRNPIDRIISEYYFIKDRPEFMNLLKPIPKNLTSYIKNKQTRNYMVGFLVGKRMYDEDIVNEEDLNLAVNTIDSLNIKVGIFDYYKASLNYFSSITKIKIPKKIDVKRITLNRPKIEDVSEEIKELIIEKFLKIHIREQIKNGATLIQIFDSWAGLLKENDLPNYVYIPTLNLVNYVKSLNVPVICFPRGIKDYKNFCKIVKPNCISIDYDIDPILISKEIEIPIQGGLDPKILLSDKENLKKETLKYLDIFKNRPYIFNLGHGVIPETKPSMIEYLVKLVKDY